jgi:hypothetical protein
MLRSSLADNVLIENTAFESDAFEHFTLVNK